MELLSVLIIPRRQIGLNSLCHILKRPSKFEQDMTGTVLAKSNVQFRKLSTWLFFKKFIKDVLKTFTLHSLKHKLKHRFGNYLKRLGKQLHTRHVQSLLSQGPEKNTTKNV